VRAPARRLHRVPRGRFQTVRAGRVVAVGAASTNKRRTPRAWSTRSSRRRTRSRRWHHAGHGGQRRPLWYHLIALVVATDAPPIRHEAWATLQEWVVCSSIFVVGRGVKAGLPGSMPRGTLNARSERAPGRTGRVVAEPLIFAPRPALPRWLCRSHSVVRPSPRSSNYGENGDGSTEPQAASWLHAIVLTRPLRRARLAAPLAVACKLQSSGHGAGTQPFVPGAMRFIYEACE